MSSSSQPADTKKPREVTFSEIVGASGATIVVERVLALLLARWLSSQVGLLLVPLVEGVRWPPLTGWFFAAGDAVIFTAATLAAFRWIKGGGVVAAFAAALAATLLQPLVAAAVLRTSPLSWFTMLLIPRFARDFLLLAGMVLVLRKILLAPAALVIGAVAGTLVFRMATFAFGRGYFEFTMMGMGSFGNYDFLQAALFGAILAGGVRLLSPPGGKPGEPA